jgi:Ca2+/Na+ antiporter
MKWLFDRVWWIIGLLIAILIVLFVFAYFMNQFNSILYVLIAILAVIILFLIILGWREHQREIKTKNELTSFKNELEYNLQILGYNQNILDEELKMIEENKFSEKPKRNKLVLRPLLPLKIGLWEILLIVTFPDELKSEFMVKIRDIDMQERKINEQIKSRENYKNVNIENHDISSTIKRYDQILQKNCEELRAILMDIGMQIYKIC